MWQRARIRNSHVSKATQVAHFEIGASSRWLFSARSPRESTSRIAACQLAAWFSGSAAASSELLRSVSSV